MSLENNKSNFFTERLLPIALCGTLIAIPGCSAKDKIGESSADKNNKQEEAQKPEIKEKNKTSVNNFQEPKIRVCENTINSPSGKIDSIAFLPAPDNSQVHNSDYYQNLNQNLAKLKKLGFKRIAVQEPNKIDGSKSYEFMKRVSPMIEKHKLNPVLWVSNTFGGEKYYYKAAANITNTVKYPEWFLHDNNGKLITKKESGVDHVFLNPFSKSLQVEQQRLVLKFANVLRANEVMYDDNAIPLKDEVFMEAVEFKNKYGQNPTDQNRQDVYRSRLKFLRKMLHDDNKKFLLSTQYSMDKRNSRFDSPVMAANYADEHIPQVYHKNKENPELDYEFHKVISGRVREHRQALKIKSDLKVTPLVIGDENIPQNITKMANCIYSEFNTPSIGIFMNIGHLSKLEEIKSTK